MTKETVLTYLAEYHPVDPDSVKAGTSIEEIADGASFEVVAEQLECYYKVQLPRTWHQFKRQFATVGDLAAYISHS